VEEGDRTAAAGRHTEQEAAETVPAPASASPPPPPPPPAPAPAIERELELAEEPASPAPRRTGAKKKLKAAPGGGGSGSIGGGGSGGGSGSGYGSGLRSGGSSESSSKGTVTIRTPEVDGVLSAAVVSRVLASRRGRLTYCYEKQLQVNPTLAGTLTISFVIGADGTVTSATSTESSLGDDAAGACLVATIRQAAFPSRTRAASRR